MTLELRELLVPVFMGFWGLVYGAIALWAFRRNDKIQAAKKAKKAAAKLIGSRSQSNGATFQ